MILYISAFCFVVLGAFINRLRGTNFRQFFGLTDTPEPIEPEPSKIDILGSKGMTSLYMGCAFFLLLLCAQIQPAEAAICAFITWGGLWLWAVPGWGKYFVSASGSPGVYMNDGEEVKWIDAASDKIITAFYSETLKMHLHKIYSSAGHYPYLDYNIRVALWGTIAMSLRGMLMAPLFVALAFFLNPALCMGMALLCLMQGPIYHVGRYMIQYRTLGKKLWGGNHAKASEVLHGAFISAQLCICAIGA